MKSSVIYPSRAFDLASTQDAFILWDHPADMDRPRGQLVAMCNSSGSQDIVCVDLTVVGFVGSFLDTIFRTSVDSNGNSALCNFGVNRSYDRIGVQAQKNINGVVSATVPTLLQVSLWLKFWEG